MFAVATPADMLTLTVHKLCVTMGVPRHLHVTQLTATGNVEFLVLGLLIMLINQI